MGKETTVQNTKPKSKKSYCVPILLKGHERPITSVVFNREGDLLFSSSKGDRESIKATVWRTSNGERLGTYKGHTGSINKIDVDYDTKNIVTAGADNFAKIFDVETGDQKLSFNHPTLVMASQWALGSTDVFMTVTSKLLGANSEIRIFDARSGDKPIQSHTPLNTKLKISTGRWGPLNKSILIASEDGTLRSLDIRNWKEIVGQNTHTKIITDITTGRDDMFALTSSKDGTAKLWDLQSLKVLKTYTTGRPILSADISSAKDEIVTIGGQEASAVTGTRSDHTQFRAKFFHLYYQEFLGIFSVGHFSPVNAIRYSPNGKSFVTGGEDGYVRLHHFDQNYFDFWGTDMYSSFENLRK